MRKRIYEIIELSSDDDKWSSYYDVFMMIVIFVSIIPLAFKEDYIGFEIIEAVTAVIFVFDYLFSISIFDLRMS